MLPFEQKQEILQRQPGVRGRVDRCVENWTKVTESRNELPKEGGLAHAPRTQEHDRPSDRSADEFDQS